MESAAVPKPSLFGPRKRSLGLGEKVDMERSGKRRSVARDPQEGASGNRRSDFWAAAGVASGLVRAGAAATAGPGACELRHRWSPGVRARAGSARPRPRASRQCEGRRGVAGKKVNAKVRGR